MNGGEREYKGGREKTGMLRGIRWIHGTGVQCAAGTVKLTRHQKASQRRNRNLQRRTALENTRLRDAVDPCLGRPHSSVGRSMLYTVDQAAAASTHENFRISHERYSELMKGALEAGIRRLKVDDETLSQAWSYVKRDQAPNVAIKGTTSNQIFPNDHEEAMNEHSDVRKAYDVIVGHDRKKAILSRIIGLGNSNAVNLKTLNTQVAMAELRHPGRYVPASDTGSSEAQAGALTVKILHLARHAQQHKHDNQSKRRYLMTVQKRQRVLRYLRRNQPRRYAIALSKLGLNDETVTKELNKVSL